MDLLRSCSQYGYGVNFSVFDRPPEPPWPRQTHIWRVRAPFTQLAAARFFHAVPPRSCQPARPLMPRDERERDRAAHGLTKSASSLTRSWRRPGDGPASKGFIELDQVEIADRDPEPLPSACRVAAPARMPMMRGAPPAEARAPRNFCARGQAVCFFNVRPPRRGSSQPAPIIERPDALPPAGHRAGELRRIRLSLRGPPPSSVVSGGGLLSLSTVTGPGLPPGHRETA